MNGRGGSCSTPMQDAETVLATHALHQNALLEAAKVRPTSPVQSTPSGEHSLPKVKERASVTSARGLTGTQGPARS